MTTNAYKGLAKNELKVAINSLKFQMQMQLPKVDKIFMLKSVIINHAKISNDIC